MKTILQAAVDKVEAENNNLLAENYRFKVALEEILGITQTHSRQILDIARIARTALDGKAAHRIFRLPKENENV